MSCYSWRKCFANGKHLIVTVVVIRLLYFNRRKLLGKIRNPGATVSC